MNAACIVNTTLFMRINSHCVFLIITNVLLFFEYLSFSKTLHFFKYRFSFILLRLLPVVFIQCEENKIKPIGVKDLDSQHSSTFFTISFRRHVYINDFLNQLIRVESKDYCLTNQQFFIRQTGLINMSVILKCTDLQF